MPIQYDIHWLQLVQHCFSLLTWSPAAHPGQPVALLELLFDLFCTFQIPMPRDLMKHKDVAFPGVKVPRTRKCFHLFPASQGSFPPPVTLKEALCLFFQTILWLNRLGPLAPCSVEQLYSLAPSSGNKTTSNRIRPCLLSPDSVSAALKLHILPHQRNLSVFLSVPVVVPRPLPDSFPDRFR